MSLLRIGFLEETNLSQKESNKNKSYYQRLGEGIQAYREGNWDNAIISLEVALESEPEDLYCLRELSKLYMKSKKYEKAIDLAHRYLKLNPGDTDFLFYIAFAHKQKRDFELAEGFSERLRLRDPKNFKNLLLLAEILMHQNLVERAGEVLNSLEEQYPENPKVLKLRSFWKKMNDTELAAQ
jgi:tetratricopeptide (TPR) repeat protein